MQRRLSTILAADFVGYSRLMEADEEATVEKLSAHRETVDNLVKSHQGRIFGSAGDSVIVEFSSPVEAVRCAVRIQEEQKNHNTGLPVDDRMELRIGINLGDVVVDQDNLLGDGVNIAARLESIADPGGITLARSVYEQVRKHLDLDYVDMGEQQLKNIADSVLVYKVATAGVEGTTNVDTSTILETRAEIQDKPSIAVLPFTNMSGDSEQEYFSDGITEDIITALTRISGLTVIARNTIMTYKDKAVDVKQVGQELQVRYVLEGSVRKAGNRVRVTGQLIDTETGHHRWADRYDRDLDDIFAVQDDITLNITVEMRVQLSIGEKARMLAGRTNSVVAWEKQLLADELNNNFIRGDNWKARRLCKEVLKIDPNYVSAWTELGWTYLEDVLCGWTDNVENSLDKTLSTIDKVVALERDYPLALSLLGYVHALRSDYDQAVEVSEKSVLLAPDNAEAVAELGHMLLFAGRTADALAEVKKAICLCPVRLMWHLTIMGQCLHAEGLVESAIETYREAVRKGPDSPFPRICLISALMDAGERQEAGQIAHKVLQQEHDFSLSRWRGAHFRDIKVRNRILNHLADAGLPP
jgi:adenylate cyclase